LDYSGAAQFDDGSYFFYAADSELHMIRARHMSGGSYQYSIALIIPLQVVIAKPCLPNYWFKYVNRDAYLLFIILEDD
jgi:hypothetical protein